MQVPDQVRSDFTRMMQRSEPGIDLARAALLVAAESDPAMSVDEQVGILDQWGATLKSRLDPSWNNLQRLARLRAFVYDELGFRGDTRDYFDRRNSLLHAVMARRRGVPLTLAIVLLELGWRIGMPLEGVGFPGHFLVRLTGEPGDLVLDPFHEARSVHEEDARALLATTTGGRVAYDPELLASVGKRDMILRLLHNLKNACLLAGDDPGALAAVERLLVLEPDGTGEMRDLGLLLQRMGRTAAAIAALRAYLASAPAALDRDDVEARLEALRASLPWLN
jgi:regulator of sirC expression with transglutaminase-like and TPR domain